MSRRTLMIEIFNTVLPVSLVVSLGFDDPSTRTWLLVSLVLVCQIGGLVSYILDTKRGIE